MLCPQALLSLSLVKFASVLLLQNLRRTRLDANSMWALPLMDLGQLRAYHRLGCAYGQCTSLQRDVQAEFRTLFLPLKN
jgi:hypothetical protein